MDKMDSAMVSVLLNGEPREIPEGLNIPRLLEWLGIDAARVAVELNRQIIRKPDWESSTVPAGSEVEVVMFVGGGRDSFGHN